MIRLANWYFLMLIPILLILFLAKKRMAALKFSSVRLLKDSGMKKTRKHKLGKYLFLASLLLLDFALSRPQLALEAAPVRNKGIDIALTLDVSTSMQIMDMEPSRLEVARATMKNFIQARTDDRLALIVFSGSAYTRVPLTLDHDVVLKSLDSVTTKSVSGGGTAVGMAIAVGLKRLEKSDASSKIIILVTDGQSNAGLITPETAADMAKKSGIKIYSIGVGTNVNDPIKQDEVQNQLTSDSVNTNILQSIAETTGGLFYLAEDPEALSKVFDDINKLEKTEFKQENYRQYKELAFPFIEGALIILLAGMFFDRYYYVRIP